MPKFMGLADITVDGNTLAGGDSATLDTGGVTRTPVKGSQVYGFREEVKEATLECEVAVGADFSIDDLRNVTDASVSFLADTGQAWTIQHAWCADAVQISQKDGKAKVKFQGPPAEETL